MKMQLRLLVSRFEVRQNLTRLSCQIYGSTDKFLVSVIN